MSAPAHKQTNPSAYPGQIVNTNWLQKLTPVPATTFEEWWMRYNTLHGCPPAVDAAKAAWYAALGVKECNNS